MTDTPQSLLAHHLKALKLPTFLREYDKLARQCAAEGVRHVFDLSHCIDALFKHGLRRIPRVIPGRRYAAECWLTTEWERLRLLAAVAPRITPTGRGCWIPAMAYGPRGRAQNTIVQKSQHALSGGIGAKPADSGGLGRGPPPVGNSFLKLPRWPGRHCTSPSVRPHAGAPPRLSSGRTIRRFGIRKRYRAAATREITAPASKAGVKVPVAWTTKPVTIGAMALPM